ncbi:hypothetical protein [Streptomyces spongiae]|uniref:hypothetical protein n=1 Tax=Streptomyces spongiae TaxID=565072 RepID=UPI001883D9A8|nr:hypothetical protein [Streptomyces spongiae]
MSRKWSRLCSLTWCLLEYPAMWDDQVSSAVAAVGNHRDAADGDNDPGALGVATRGGVSGAQRRGRPPSSDGLPKLGPDPEGPLGEAARSTSLASPEETAGSISLISAPVLVYGRVDRDVRPDARAAHGALGVLLGADLADHDHDPAYGSQDDTGPALPRWRKRQEVRLGHGGPPARRSSHVAPLLPILHTRHKEIPNILDRSNEDPVSRFSGYLSRAFGT